MNFTMDISFLAQFMGVLMVIIGVAMLIRRKVTLRALDEVFKSPGLIYSIGIAQIAVGLLVVMSKGDFGGALGSVLAILGWLLLIEGFVYMTATVRSMKKLLKWLHSKQTYYFVSLVYVLLGVWLVYGTTI